MSSKDAFSCHLPGAAGSPQLCYVHCLPSTLVSWCLYLCAFQLQRLVYICLCWDGAGCAEDPEPARATGQPLCSERATTLPAKKSFLVGRLSSPVPLLAIFLSPPLLVTASSCLLGQLPACCISLSPLQTSTLLCDQQLSWSVPNHGPPLAARPPCEAHRTSWWLPASAVSQCFSVSLRR